MKHYLITGGAGFIGSNLIRVLFETQPDIIITCIDNFDPFYDEKIKRHNIHAFAGNKNFKLIQVDISSTSSKDLKNLIPDAVDVVVHLAAKAGVRPSILDPIGYQRTNILGLQHLLDFAKEQSVPQFVFASSSSVYGINENFPWKETEPLLPISPYAMTKLSGEMLGHVYYKLYGIRFIPLRFFTVYGPGQRPDLAIHKFTKSIVNNIPIPMYGDGSSSRDYTYVDDVVDGITAAMQYNKTDYEIINIGNHYTVTLRELIQELENILNRKAIINELPEQPGDLPKTYADISKAGELLDYYPQTTLRQGLEKFAEWYMANQYIL